MKYMVNILKEQMQYSYLITRLSSYEMKTKNRSNFLGSLWEIINPLIQLFIYWFVFQNVRQHSNITLSNGAEVPYFYWLLIGFVFWMFFYKATIEGSNSIYTRIRMLSKMNFPMSIVPSFVIFSHFYVHLVMLCIGLILLQLGGFFMNIHYIELLYFIPATLFFIFSISLITSTASILARDAHMLLNALLRMFMYLSPVLWEIGDLGGVIGTIAKLNPLYYLIEGYRAAFFGTEWYAVTHIEYTLYFWGITLFLFGIGATIHMKLRRHFVDFL